MAPADELLDAVRDRLARNQRVRRTLEPWGRLHVDRQLPFLVVYRRPPRRDDSGTERLATTSASYLCASGARASHADVSRLVRTVTDVQLEAFGGFLLLELWTGPDEGGPAPAFRLHVPRDFAEDATVTSAGWPAPVALYSSAPPPPLLVSVAGAAGTPATAR